MGGFGRISKSGENVHSPSPSASSSEPPNKFSFSPCTPEPFAYSPGSGGRNQGRTGYHGKKGGGQGCLVEGWEEISPGHKASVKRSLQTGSFRARGGRGYALGAGLLGRTAPGHALCLRTHRGRIRTKRARAFASGTGVYVISAWIVWRTVRTGRTRTQGNIFVDERRRGRGRWVGVWLRRGCHSGGHRRPQGQ